MDIIDESTSRKRSLETNDAHSSKKMREEFVFYPTPTGPYAFDPFLIKYSPRALKLINKIIGRNESNKIKKEDIIISSNAMHDDEWSVDSYVDINFDDNTNEPVTLNDKKEYAHKIHNGYYNQENEFYQDILFTWIDTTPIFTDEERYKLFKYLSEHDRNLFVKPNNKYASKYKYYDPYAEVSYTEVANTDFDDETERDSLNSSSVITGVEDYIDRQIDANRNNQVWLDNFYKKYSNNNRNKNEGINKTSIPNYEERKANDKNYIFNINWNTSSDEEIDDNFMNDINKYLNIDNSLFELRPTNITIMNDLKLQELYNKKLLDSTLPSSSKKSKKKSATPMDIYKWIQEYLTLADWLYTNSILTLNSKTKLYLKLKELGLLIPNPDFEKIMDADPWNISGEVLSNANIKNKNGTIIKLQPDNIEYIKSMLTGTQLNEINKYDSKKDYEKTGIGGKSYRRKKQYQKKRNYTRRKKYSRKNK